MTTLDYETVSRYWSTADSSILGPYMMDGFGFPAAAGRFRFRAECRIVNRLIHEVNPDGCVLDFGWLRARLGSLYFPSGKVTRNSLRPEIHELKGAF